jgi:hypothetical protein
MRTHIFQCLLAAIAIGGAVFSSPTAERRREAVQIDFASLHDQARSALYLLQEAQERRIAFQETDNSAF